MQEKYGSPGLSRLEGSTSSPLDSSPAPMSQPPIRHWMLSEPRSGGATEDYEDAAALEADAWPVRAAVADGATESVFAGAWAHALVERLVARPQASPDAFTEAVTEARARWGSSAADRARDRPWYVQAKASEGAFATVLALTLHEDGTWGASVVGDCCLFHLRAGRTLRAWPFTDPDAFTNRPALVSSRPDRPVPSPLTASGTWTAGDRWLLATDAVAAWLLRTDPGALEPDEQAFSAAVRAAREDGPLRNDDATLLVLDLEQTRHS